MRILPFKYVHVTEGLFVKVSRHFMYTDFGIRDNGEMRFTGRRFVMDSTPGSGFIERDSESHSYHQFVRKGLAHQKKPSYWRFLLGKEPSFKREIAAVRRALPDCDTKRRREILECYLNALVIAERNAPGFVDHPVEDVKQFQNVVRIVHRSVIPSVALLYFQFL